MKTGKMTSQQRGIVLASAAAVLLGGSVAAGKFRRGPNVTPGPLPEGGIRLHSGWRITPAGQTPVKVADMLLASALSPNGRLLAVVSAGYGKHTLNLMDAQTGTLVAEVPMLQAWNGVAWGPDSRTVYVSGGASLAVHQVQQQADGTWNAGDNLILEGTDAPKKAYLAGTAISADGKTLYVADTLNDSVYALSLPGGKLQKAVKLDKQVRPFALRVGPDGQVYVGEWGNSRVSVLDNVTLKPRKTLAVGDHPNDLRFTPDGKRLFVTCANDDTVCVVDLANGKTTERIRMGLTPQSPPGSTPCALAIAPDGRTLYVANADNNDVAVVDISRPNQSRVNGFIPTGWYPTMVAVSADGKRLFLGSGKGNGTVPNPGKPVTPDSVSPNLGQYIGRMLFGTITTLPVPSETQLAAYTKQVLSNTPYTGDAILTRPAAAPPPGTNAIPSRLGDASPIKHVLYIIKENRTYDQVFGDMKDASGKPLGNGDPNLCLFGDDVTPNQHALARQYVLLDNIYCSGEVSADGHPWSDGAIATDFTQRTWPVSYSKKGDPPAAPTVTVPKSGYIWDAAARKNLLYRSYGEQTFAVSSDAPPQPLESSDGATSLKGHASRAWRQAGGKRDFIKADVFIAELKEFEKNNNFPHFMVMSLGENHTRGTRAGEHTPKACVASNDVAVGKIVDAISHSKFWPTTAIFIIEDDAQNGPDHVDAHRTASLVISPYTKRGAVDSTFYTTVSLLRTMELILGLPPLTQYDAASTPMYASFTNKPDLTPFTVLPARVDLNARNLKTAFGASRMAKIDFSEYDLLTVDDEQALNQAIWASVKGTPDTYPGPVRRALVTPSTGRSIIGNGDEDEEEEREERERKASKGGKVGKPVGLTERDRDEDDD